MERPNRSPFPLTTKLGLLPTVCLAQVWVSAAEYNALRYIYLYTVVNRKQSCVRVTFFFFFSLLSPAFKSTRRNFWVINFLLGSHHEKSNGLVADLWGTPLYK